MAILGGINIIYRCFIFFFCGFYRLYVWHIKEIMRIVEDFVNLSNLFFLVEQQKGVPILKIYNYFRYHLLLVMGIELHKVVFICGVSVDI